MRLSGKKQQAFPSSLIIKQLGRIRINAWSQQWCVCNARNLQTTVAISNPAGQQGEVYLVIVYEVGEELVLVDIAEGVANPLCVRHIVYDARTTSHRAATLLFSPAWTVRSYTSYVNRTKIIVCIAVLKGLLSPWSSSWNLSISLLPRLRSRQMKIYTAKHENKSPIRNTPKGNSGSGPRTRDGGGRDRI
jgi:hypothetical protein